MNQHRVAGQLCGGEQRETLTLTHFIPFRTRDEDEPSSVFSFPLASCYAPPNAFVLLLRRHISSICLADFLFRAKCDQICLVGASADGIANKRQSNYGNGNNRFDKINARFASSFFLSALRWLPPPSLSLDASAARFGAPRTPSKVGVSGKRQAHSFRRGMCGEMFVGTNRLLSESGSSRAARMRMNVVYGIYGAARVLPRPVITLIKSKHSGRATRISEEINSESYTTIATADNIVRADRRER